ncbi:MAG: hypothetical protein ACRDQ1_13255 [Sciscionella sp.]
MTEQPGEAEPEDFATVMRRSSAACAHLASRSVQQAEDLDRLAVNAGPMLAALGLEPPTVLARESRALAEQLRLVGQINAAQAIAYEDMMAAGGPDDPQAYAAYQRTCERHSDLMPNEPRGEIGTN